jgi:hypothetical protein
MKIIVTPHRVNNLMLLSVETDISGKRPIAKRDIRRSQRYVSDLRLKVNAVIGRKSFLLLSVPRKRYFWGIERQKPSKKRPAARNS